MKPERFFSCLCGGLLAFCVGFGGAACMVTGLGLTAVLPVLALGCALAAVLASGCLYFPRGGLILWVLALICGVFLIPGDNFLNQAGALAAHILGFYERAYGFTVPEFLVGMEAFTHQLPLQLFSGVAISLCCRTVCRAKGVVLTMAVSILPLMACLVVTDTVPDTPWLYLLLFGLSLLLLTQTLRRRDPSQAPKLTAMLAVPLAGALALMFMLIPREGYTAPEVDDSLERIAAWLEQLIPDADRSSEGEPVLDFGTDRGSKVELGAQGSREVRDTPVMEATATFSDTLYLRGRSYVGYDGRSWQASGDLEEKFGASAMWMESTNASVTLRTYTAHRCLYLPYYPADTQELRNGQAENSTNATLYTLDTMRLQPLWRSTWKTLFGQLYAAGDLREKAWEQMLSSSLYEPTASGESFSAGPVMDTVDPRYTELPEETQRRAKELLQQILTGSMGHSTPVDIAQQIVNYVRSSAEYDLNPGTMPGDTTDFALWFLEKSDKGYCVHFASAAVVLLRSAGIPARYVEGYMVEAEAHVPTIVRESMAHAWAEYYVDGLGWVILDATPAGPDVPSDTAAPTETIPPTEPTEAPTETPTAPTETTPTETASSTKPPAEGPKITSKGLAALPGWLAALAAAAALIWGQWQLRRAHLLRAQRRGSRNARALARWRETERLCRLLKQPPPGALKKLAEKAKFSQHTITAEELAQFTQTQQELVTQMRSSPWYRRLAYRLIFAAY